MMHGRGFYDGGWFGMGGLGSGWAWLIGIGVLLIVIAVTYLIVRKNRSVRGTLDFDALEILKNKFALGEITEEEYNNRRKIIK